MQGGREEDGGRGPWALGFGHWQAVRVQGGPPKGPSLARMLDSDPTGAAMAPHRICSNILFSVRKEHVSAEAPQA